MTCGPGDNEGGRAPSPRQSAVSDRPRGWSAAPDGFAGPCSVDPRRRPRLNGERNTGRTKARRRSTVAGVSILAILAGVAVIGAAIISSNPPGPDVAVLPTIASTAPTSTSTAGAGSLEPDPERLGIITPTVRGPEGLEDGRAIGRRDAPATLTLWEDFQCPYCGRFTREIEPRLYADYVVPGKLRIVFRDWVFIGVESVAAAVAARCAGEQGQFWAYHDYLLWNQKGENKGGFSGEHLDAMAQAVGLDLPAFDTCLADKAQVAAVQAETEAGSQAKIGMTPTLVVDDKVMPGAPTSEADYAHLRAVIDASIAAHASGQPEASPS